MTPEIVTQVFEEMLIFIGDIDIKFLGLHMCQGVSFIMEIHDIFTQFSQSVDHLLSKFSGQALTPHLYGTDQ